MPNIGKVLKEEFQRLARKEVKTLTAKPHKDTVALKKTLAGFKKRIAQLERSLRFLVSAENKRSKLQPAVAPEKAEKLRFSAKGIRSLRRKLKLSQADFAKLVGVSSLAVYQWERKEGRLNLRGHTKNALAAIRGLGRKEVLKRLEEKTEPTAPKKRRKRRR